MAQIHEFRGSEEETEKPDRPGIIPAQIPHLSKTGKALAVLAILTVAALLTAFLIYGSIHLFTGYTIIRSAADPVVEGSEYALLGDCLIKYGHDGVTCSDSAGNTKWAAAFSMQTPISETAGDVMVIAEQQGKQVYVLDKNGIRGSFSTALPIHRVSVSAGGISLLILEDEEASWVNLYDLNGTNIASVKATLTDTGYPLDAAISPDGRRMMVSYLTIENGNMEGRIAFYDFSSASAGDDSRLRNVLSYQDTLFPDVFYNSASVPAAIGDNCFVTFSSASVPTERTNIAVAQEIVSCFHSDRYIGFVFRSMHSDMKYDLQIFRYSGEEVLSTSVDFEFAEVYTEGSDILFHDRKSLHIIRMSGREKLRTDYEKEVLFFRPSGGIRKYLVATPGQIDQIRLK